MTAFFTRKCSVCVLTNLLCFTFGGHFLPVENWKIFKWPFPSPASVKRREKNCHCHFRRASLPSYTIRHLHIRMNMLHLLIHYKPYRGRWVTVSPGNTNTGPPATGHLLSSAVSLHMDAERPSPLRGASPHLLIAPDKPAPPTNTHTLKPPYPLHNGCVVDAIYLKTPGSQLWGILWPNLPGGCQMLTRYTAGWALERWLWDWGT